MPGNAVFNVGNVVTQALGAIAQHQIRRDVSNERSGKATEQGAVKSRREFGNRNGIQVVTLVLVERYVRFAGRQAGQFGEDWAQFVVVGVLHQREFAIGNAVVTFYLAKNHFRTHIADKCIPVAADMVLKLIPGRGGIIVVPVLKIFFKIETIPARHPKKH